MPYSGKISLRCFRYEQAQKTYHSAYPASQRLQRILRILVCILVAIAIAIAIAITIAGTVTVAGTQARNDAEVGRMKISLTWRHVFHVALYQKHPVRNEIWA